MLNNRKDIILWLKDNGIEKYRINKDLSVDIFQDVDLSYHNNNNPDIIINPETFILPIIINSVHGFFECSYHNLINLKNITPKYCKKLILYHTGIESLEGLENTESIIICGHNLKNLSYINNSIKEIEITQQINSYNKDTFNIEALNGLKIDKLILNDNNITEKDLLKCVFFCKKIILNNNIRNDLTSTINNKYLFIKKEMMDINSLIINKEHKKNKSKL